MKRAWISLFAFAVAAPLWAQDTKQDPPRREGAVQDLTVRGKIVRMEAPDRFVVQSGDNKEVIFYTNPQTRYTIDGKTGRYADLRVGTEVTTGYLVRDNRHYVNTVTIGAVTPPRVVEQVDRPARAQDATVMRGRIVRTQAPDVVMIRTSDGKEVNLYTGAQTRYTINGKPAQFADFRVGVDIDAEFMVRDGRHIVTVLTAGGRTIETPAAPDAPTTTEPTSVQGTIVRVVGEDQVVVKTQDNKEITIYVQPQTKYVINEQPARFTDFRTGSDIRVQYDLRDRRPIARAIFGRRN